MVKLIIQEKNIKKHRFRNHKKSSLLVKVLELVFRLPILELVYSGSSDVVSLGDWLVSSTWSICPQVSCNWEVR
jgi:hypothetical protein